MITDDYCSYEIAKLLKEKGFYQDFLNATIPVWKLNGSKKELAFYGDDNYPCEWEEWYSAPTLQMAMKWLREEYKIAINIRITCGKTISYAFDVWDFEIIHPNEFVGGTIDLREQQFGFKSYEDAVEAALKYVLENLI